MTDSGIDLRWRLVPRDPSAEFPYARYERDPEGGPGPGVILMHEFPGLSAAVARLGDALVDAGFTVWIPELFEPPLRSVGGTARFARGCVTREFAAFARDKERGIASRLGKLAAMLAQDTEGRPVGIIGMCFTGGFALAAAAVPGSPITASVVSQPALPYPLIVKRMATKNDPGLSAPELDRLKARSDFCAMGLRFRNDRISREGRFDALTAALGKAFTVIPIPRDGDRDSTIYPRKAHSVLTPGAKELPADPVKRAAAERELAGIRDQVITFLRDRLGS